MKVIKLTDFEKRILLGLCTDEVCKMNELYKDPYDQAVICILENVVLKLEEA